MKWTLVQQGLLSAGGRGRNADLGIPEAAGAWGHGGSARKWVWKWEQGPAPSLDHMRTSFSTVGIPNAVGHRVCGGADRGGDGDGKEAGGMGSERPAGGKYRDNRHLIQKVQGRQGGREMAPRGIFHTLSEKRMGGGAASIR